MPLAREALSGRHSQAPGKPHFPPPERTGVYGSSRPDEGRLPGGFGGHGNRSAFRTKNVSGAINNRVRAGPPP